MEGAGCISLRFFWFCSVFDCSCNAVSLFWTGWLNEHQANSIAVKNNGSNSSFFIS